MQEKLFTVFPMSQRYSLEAGNTYQGSIIVANPMNATEDFSYIVSIEPYNTFDDAESFAQTKTYSDIVNWITIDNPTGTIRPNEHATVSFTINVPEGVPAGGQYAAVVVAENPDTATSNDLNFNNILVLASIIYADVTGDTIRDGSILENTIPGFTFNPNLTLTTAIENRGNTHSDALVVIEVKNIFDDQVVFPAEDETMGNFKEIVLPETIRYINHRVDNLPPLGVFNVTQTVYFNDAVSTTEQRVIICPLWFLFVVIFTIILLATIIVARIRHHHKRRQARRRERQEASLFSRGSC